MNKAIYSKEELKRHAIVAHLPFHRKVVAYGLIERGADLAILYLWFNLIHGHYNHISIAIVMEHITDYMHNYPDFESDIAEWFQHFEQQLKDEKNNRTH